MLVQPVVIPGSGTLPWTMLGDDDVPVVPVDWFLTYLTDIGRSSRQTVSSAPPPLRDAPGTDLSTLTKEIPACGPLIYMVPGSRTVNRFAEELAQEEIAASPARSPAVRRKRWPGSS